MLAALLARQGDRGDRAEVLHLAGHETREAADGAAGVIALRTGVFDAVLLDMCMPYKEGIETLQEIL